MCNRHLELLTLIVLPRDKCISIDVKISGENLSIAFNSCGGHSWDFFYQAQSISIVTNTQYHLTIVNMRQDQEIIEIGNALFITFFIPIALDSFLEI